MKKLVVILLALVVIVCGLCYLDYLRCEYAMKEAYIEQCIPEDMKDAYTPNMIQIWSYGTYDGCTVGYFGSKTDGSQALSVELVAGQAFYYPSPVKMLAYKNGEFKSMEEAYRCYWLDKDAISQILEKHRRDLPELYGTR